MPVSCRAGYHAVSVHRLYSAREDTGLKRQRHALDTDPAVRSRLFVDPDRRVQFAKQGKKRLLLLLAKGREKLLLTDRTARDVIIQP